MKHLVNPISITQCFISHSDFRAEVRDISLVRLVVERLSAWDALDEGEFLDLRVKLDAIEFSVRAKFEKRSENSLRFSFENILPSARAHLKSFLSAKKVGESLLQDWASEKARHFHGLNESELWFHKEGAVLFSYLDQEDPDRQFVIHRRPGTSRIDVGTISRADYMCLDSLDKDLELRPLSGGTLYERVEECRDVVTNFRPVGDMEFHLKQELLLLISSYLYSTRRGFDPTAYSPAP